MVAARDFLNTIFEPAFSTVDRVEQLSIRARSINMIHFDLKRSTIAKC